MNTILRITDTFGKASCETPCRFKENSIGLVRFYSTDSPPEPGYPVTRFGPRNLTVSRTTSYTYEHPEAIIPGKSVS